jgi:hypothetical protein
MRELFLTNSVARNILTLAPIAGLPELSPLRKQKTGKAPCSGCGDRRNRVTVNQQERLVALLPTLSSRSQLLILDALNVDVIKGFPDSRASRSVVLISRAATA